MSISSRKREPNSYKYITGYRKCIERYILFYHLQIYIQSIVRNKYIIIINIFVAES